MAPNTYGYLAACPSGWAASAMCASGDNHMKDCDFQGKHYSHYLVCDIPVAFTNKPPYRWHERDRTNTNGPDRGDQMTTAYLNKGCPRNHLMTALCASGEDSDQCQQWGSPFHGSMAFQCHEVDTSQYEIKYVGEGGDPSEADKHFFHELIEQPGKEHRGTDPAPTNTRSSAHIPIMGASTMHMHCHPSSTWQRKAILSSWTASTPHVT